MSIIGPFTPKRHGPQRSEDADAIFDSWYNAIGDYLGQWSPEHELEAHCYIVQPLMDLIGIIKGSQVLDWQDASFTAYDQSKVLAVFEDLIEYEHITINVIGSICALIFGDGYSDCHMIGIAVTGNDVSDYHNNQVCVELNRIPTNQEYMLLDRILYHLLPSYVGWHIIYNFGFILDRSLLDGYTGLLAS